jgi:hypothetical protein
MSLGASINEVVLFTASMAFSIISLYRLADKYNRGTFSFGTPLTSFMRQAKNIPPSREIPPKAKKVPEIDKILKVAAVQVDIKRMQIQKVRLAKLNPDSDKVTVPIYVQNPFPIQAW